MGYLSGHMSDFCLEVLSSNLTPVTDVTSARDTATLRVMLMSWQFNSWY